LKEVSKGGINNEIRNEAGKRDGAGKLEEARERRPAVVNDIYISLHLCKMTDARASHINAEQGTIKAQNTINTIKLGQLNRAIKCPSDGVVGLLVQRMSQGSPLMP
jgi:hypothetical protein